MSSHKLILHPQNSRIGIRKLDDFIADLHEIGFIDRDSEIYDVAFDETSFEAGKNFLKLIDFVHNRRVMVLDQTGVKEIADNRTMCWVEVIDYGEQVTLHGANMYTQYLQLQCPSCRFEKDIDAAYAILSKWDKNRETYRWQCEQCARRWHVYDLNWHDGFAFTRCAIDISHIHYGEALPTPEFLEFLREKTGGAWSYFYYKV